MRGSFQERGSLRTFGDRYTCVMSYIFTPIHAWLIGVLVSDCRRNSQIFLGLREGGTKVPTSGASRAGTSIHGGPDPEIQFSKHLTGFRV